MNDINFDMYIVATPIGNLKDISQRSVEVINQADFVICENPKHSLKLLNKLGIKKKLISLHDYNENLVINRISEKLVDKKFVLISDAGSPLISDPGYKLIQHCIKNNVKISSVPGPCSIIPALQLSGIPLNEFSYLGFFPKTKKNSIDYLNKIKENNQTSVFLVSNHRIRICIDLLEKELGERNISISKELTKINEKVFRGLGRNIKEIISKDKDFLKGEFVIVVEGKSSKKTNVSDLDNNLEEISNLLLKFSLTEVAQIVHKLTGITKNKVYKWLLNLKKS